MSAALSLSHAAHALGGDVYGRDSILVPGPGHSPRDRSLRVTILPDGWRVHSFAGDDFRDCRDHVRARLRLEPYVPQRNLNPEPRPVPNDPDRTARALALWREARPIKGTPAEAYLTSRGVSYEGGAPRWHPACPFGRGVRHGCMLGLVRNITTNEPQAIHRTALTPDGRKIDRKAFGPLAGGAVKLTEDGDVAAVVAIGEGIETTLSIRALPGLSQMPVWACISAGGVASFPVLPGIEAVWIAVDHDASATGAGAAQEAGERLDDAEIEVVLVTPETTGADINDMVRHGPR